MSCRSRSFIAFHLGDACGIGIDFQIWPGPPLHRVDGIDDEVDENLLHFRQIDKHRRQVFFKNDLDIDVSFADFVSSQEQGILYQRQQFVGF